MDDVVVDIGKEFRNDQEGVIEVELVAEKPQNNFLEPHVLEAVYFFSVVVGDESSVHFPDF